MLENFVNFIGREINPAVINSYKGSDAYEENDFFGADGSTGNYTKAGYALSVYGAMLVDGKNVSGAEDAVTDILSIVSDGVTNKDVLGRDGDSPFAQAVFSNQGAESSVFDALLTMSNPNPNTLFSTQLESGLVLKLIERNLAAPMISIVAEFTNPENYMTKSTQDIVSKYLSEVCYGILRIAELKLSSSEYTDLTNIINIMVGIVSSKTYSEKFGANPVSTGSGIGVTNDIARIINGSSHNIFKEIMVSQGILSGMLAPKEEVLGNISAAYGTIPETIARNSATFNIGTYDSGVFEQQKGYNPLMYYIAKYANSCNKETLDELLLYFSSFAISVDAGGGSEGFNALGLAAYHCKLTGNTFEGSLASFVKGEMSKAGSTAIKAWYISGNVSVFSGGTSNNAFGAVTNIYDKIVAFERTWREENQGEDFADTYSSVAGSILPSIFNNEFYQLWKAEFGITMD